MARLEASISTGSVTSWKSTASENSTMPIVRSGWKDKMMPMKNSGSEKFVPILTTGTSEDLMRSGA